ncbi:MAG: protein translocase subunit SecF [Chloroflexi bacterium]|nr:protein translocase subunit SecF [Chloroflexota bacterium]MCH7655031.1 protein translocase subunit SecF [Chloroflexota bacterium]
MGVVRYRKWFFLVSGLLVLASIVTLFWPPALKPGIDFSGGAALTVDFAEPVTGAQVSAALDRIGHPEAIVQGGGNNRFFIRLGSLELDELDDEGNVVVARDETLVRQALDDLGGAQIGTFDFVSGVIGAENVRNAMTAVLVASLVILIYVTWAFRRVPSPFRYGTAAVIALAHDVLIVLGVFSILGKLIGLEVNAMFITGVLATIGYSVNDTIVVFDRVRENVARYPGAAIAELVNISVRETVGRSLNTSITLLVVVASLLLFAGPSIKPLLYVLLTGVIVGTYSSIFIASLILVSWEQGEIGAMFRRIPLLGRRARA